MSGYFCDQCGDATQYQTFSGGAEYYCATCDDVFPYRADAANLPRAALLRTPEGREQLRELQAAELDRRSGNPLVSADEARREQNAWLSESEEEDHAT
jgi:hypothetical protein